MKLKLGNVYMTGGPKGQQSVTLAFWDEDSRGSPYRYVHLSLKTDMTDTDVLEILKQASEEVQKMVRNEKRKMT